MTPLAHRILANSLKPIKERLPLQEKQCSLGDLASAVCFDLSAIKPLLDWQVAKMLKVNTPWPTMFLPAERTWLEYIDDEGHRVGCFLRQHKNGKIGRFEVIFVTNPPWGFFAAWSGANWPERGGLSIVFNEGGKQLEIEMAHFIACALAAINAPKVFARVEHDPHAGLARKLAASKAMPGKYPLHAWHEIKLEGWMPKVAGGVRRAKGATGEKAQHFVRAHPRFQNGKWVIVKWHRRGNPELGMRRGRYTVEMPRTP